MAECEKDAPSLRGERVCDADSPGDPRFELPLGREVFAPDAEPALHYPSTHFHGLSERVRHKLVAVGGIDADHQTASATGRDGDVAVYEEGNPTEHSFLADAVV